jgi:hypothetical protein
MAVYGLLPFIWGGQQAQRIKNRRKPCGKIEKGARAVKRVPKGARKYKTLGMTCLLALLVPALVPGKVDNDWTFV